MVKRKRLALIKRLGRSLFPQTLLIFLTDGCWFSCHNRKHQHSGMRGSSIIEQALVYPILLGVIIGAVDITRIFQGHSLLDQGIRSALRCVSPANGDCITQVSNSTETRYDVYENSVSPRYRVQQHQYHGNASWISLPVHQIGRVQATVIDSVRYRQAQKQFRYQLEQFRPFGVVGYAVQTRNFPYIDQVASAAFIPQMRTSATSDINARATIKNGAPGITLRHVSATNSSTAAIRSAQLSFTINQSDVLSGAASPLESAERCFRQIEGGKGSSVVDFTNECDSTQFFTSQSARDAITNAKEHFNIRTSNSRLETDKYAFVVLDIRGLVSSSPGASGWVMIRISQPGGIDRQLGGRILSGTGISNFVPRGAPASFYSAAVKNRYRTEVVDHEAILLKLGVPATLHFEIEADDPDHYQLEWRASDFAVYAPHFAARSEIARCDSLVSRGRFAAKPRESCVRSIHPAGMPRAASLALPANPEKTLSEDVCLSDDNDNGSAVLIGRGVDDAENYQRLGRIAGNACGEQSLSLPCPANKGAKGLRLGNLEQEDEICDSEVASALCPLPEGTDLSTACWQLTGKDITPPSPHYWTQQECGQVEPSENEQLSFAQGYPEVIFSSQFVPELSTALFTQSVEPSDFISQHPNLECPSITIRKRSVGDELGKLKAHSLFRSTNVLGRNFEQLLFEDAQKNFVRNEDNLDPRVYFRASERIHSVLVDQPPSDSDQIYWIEPGDELSWQLIASGITDNDIPLSCQQRPQRCRKEVVSVSVTRPEGSDMLAAKAVDLGYQAIEAAMPSLVRSCTDDSRACVELVMEEERDSEGTLFVASGHIKVPLILFPQPYTAKQVGRARWERELVDR